jgi:multicomponent Na+:H+ antiporter subunit D
MNSNAEILLPLIIPLLTAIISLFFWQVLRFQRIVFMVGSFAYLIAAIRLMAVVWSHGYVTMQAGNWPAPFGITLIADLLAAGMILLTGILAFMASLYAQGGIRTPMVSNIFHPVMHFLVFGITGAFLTGDIFNLYVWFEIMLVSTFVLFTLGGSRSQLEGAIKYVAINVVSSSLFLAGIGVLYGITGTLNMADLALKLPHVEDQALVTLAAMSFS